MRMKIICGDKLNFWPFCLAQQKNITEEGEHFKVPIIITPSEIKVENNQCDQMAILWVQYLAIFSNENLPKTIEILHKMYKILPD